MALQYHNLLKPENSSLFYRSTTSKNHVYTSVYRPYK